MGVGDVKLVRGGVGDIFESIYPRVSLFSSRLRFSLLFYSFLYSSTLSRLSVCLFSHAYFGLIRKQ